MLRSCHINLSHRKVFKKNKTLIVIVAHVRPCHEHLGSLTCVRQVKWDSLLNVFVQNLHVQVHHTCWRCTSTNPLTSRDTQYNFLRQNFSWVRFGRAAIFQPEVKADFAFPFSLSFEISDLYFEQSKETNEAGIA